MNEKLKRRDYGCGMMHRICMVLCDEMPFAQHEICMMLSALCMYAGMGRIANGASATTPIDYNKNHQPEHSMSSWVHNDSLS